MANKNAGKLFFQGLLLLLLFFGLVRLIVLGKGTLILFELAVLVFLLLLTVAGLASYKNSGRRLLFLVFLLYTANVVFLWYVNHSLYLVLLIGGAIGILTGRPVVKEREKSAGSKIEVSSPPPQKISMPKIEDKPAEPKTAESREIKAVKATHTPGKYVASKRSNIYHEPKCEWAKKIRKERQLWFASREEALEKGYKKHDCVN